jgi:MerR family transcriptional regulator/heat shock protein HspR
MMADETRAARLRSGTRPHSHGRRSNGTHERDDQQAVYVISVAAELAGMHPQTLRMYERKGLVAPNRTAGNTRRYSADDIERLREIQQLTQVAGVNLAGVAEIMRLREELAAAKAQVERLRAELAVAVQAARDAVADVHKRYRAELVLYEAPGEILLHRRR